MRVAVKITVGSLEPPHAIFTGYSVRQTLLHQPIQHAVQRNAVVTALTGEFGGDFRVAECISRAHQHRKHRNTRLGGAVAFFQQDLFCIIHQRNCGTGRRLSKRGEFFRYNAVLIVLPLS